MEHPFEAGAMLQGQNILAKGNDIDHSLLRDVGPIPHFPVPTFPDHCGQAADFLNIAQTQNIPHARQNAIKERPLSKTGPLRRTTPVSFKNFNRFLSLCRSNSPQKSRRLSGPSKIVYVLRRSVDRRQFVQAQFFGLSPLCDGRR